MPGFGVYIWVLDLVVGSGSGVWIWGLKNNQEKAETFAKAIAKKTELVVSEVKVNKKEVYNGKRKILKLHEEDWLTKDLVEKTLKGGLKPKRSSGFDSDPLIFLKDAASQLNDVVTRLMMKVLEEGKTPEQWKVARIIPLSQKWRKRKN